jgi:hypothetical protein
MAAASMASTIALESDRPGDGSGGGESGSFERTTEQANTALKLEHAEPFPTHTPVCLDYASLAKNDSDQVLARGQCFTASFNRHLNICSNAWGLTVGHGRGNLSSSSLHATQCVQLPNPRHARKVNIATICGELFGAGGRATKD